MCVLACVRGVGGLWKRCQRDVGVQTDGRQASGQLAFTAFHKPFTPTTSLPYPHSVILAFAPFLFSLFFSMAVKPGWGIKSNKSNYETTCFASRLRGGSRGTRQLGTFRGV